MGQFNIALTGSIGSGKSTVCDFFKSQGIQVISADEIAFSLTKPHAKAYNTILKHFGTSILSEDETINRMKLRHILMDSCKEKKWLEQLLHPLILDAIKKQLATSQALYNVIEIPLLEQKYKFIDRILLITANQDIKIQRIMARDGMNLEQAQKMLNLQTTDEQRARLADDLIDNSGSVDVLNTECMKLHHQYLASISR